MKLYIPERIRSEITNNLNQRKGGRVYGTFSLSECIATVSDFKTSTSGNTSFTRHLLSDLESDAGPISFELLNNSLHAVYEGNESDSSPQELELIFFKDEDFFKRTPYDETVMNHLQSKKILIVGLGSMGSVIGMELATSGVGSLIGMDKDILEIHNCMRHLLGSAYIGWPKPIAMQQYLSEHVPSCEFISVYGDLFQKDRRNELRTMIEREKPTHILAVTDVLKVQYMCQRLAVEFDLPFMAVWCDNNAVEGEIFMWESGQASGWKEGRPERGCYACLRPMDRPSITRSSHFDYSTDDPDSYGGEPALGTFINRVNNIASIFTLAWLLQDCPKETKLASILNKEYEDLGLQYIRLGGAYPMNGSTTITAKNLWGVEWFRVRKNEECPICDNRETNREVLFPDLDESPDAWE